MRRRRRWIAALGLTGLLAGGAGATGVWWMQGTAVSDADLAQAGRRLPATLPLTRPRIVVAKRARTLSLFDGERLVRRYPIGLGGNPADDKRHEGDGCTPEGDFRVCFANRRSRFHLALKLDYPLPEDAERGQAAGLITAAEAAAITAAHGTGAVPPQRTGLGGEICIHGGGAGSDWTLGCIALADADVEELFAAAPAGTPVRIGP